MKFTDRRYCSMPGHGAKKDSEKEERMRSNVGNKYSSALQSRNARKVLELARPKRKIGTWVVSVKMLGKQNVNLRAEAHLLQDVH
jgi:hypothetical protein